MCATAEILDAHVRVSNFCLDDILALPSAVSYSTAPTEHSDVWSFGMLLLELFSGGRKPYHAFVGRFRAIHGTTAGVFHAVVPHLHAACDEIATTATSAPLPQADGTTTTPRMYTAASALGLALQPFSAQERARYPEVQFLEHVLARCCAFKATDRAAFATLVSELGRLHAHLGFCTGLPRCTHFATFYVQSATGASPVKRETPLRVPNDGYEAASWGSAVRPAPSPPTHERAEILNPLFPPPVGNITPGHSPNHAGLRPLGAQRRLDVDSPVRVGSYHGNALHHPVLPSASISNRRESGVPLRALARVDSDHGHAPTQLSSMEYEDDFLQPDVAPMAGLGTHP